MTDDTAATLVDRYRRASDDFRDLRARRRLTADKSQRDLLTEADVRLGQLVYVLDRFRLLTKDPGAQWVSASPVGMGDTGQENEATQGYRLFSIVELYGEAFYLFAWRLLRVLRRIEGFKKLDASGVRLVRNWLIEHADEGKEGVMSRNLVFDIPEGIKLKPYGGGAKRIHDAGLYPNATEFIAALETRLLRALETSPR